MGFADPASDEDARGDVVHSGNNEMRGGVFEDGSGGIQRSLSERSADSLLVPVGTGVALPTSIERASSEHVSGSRRVRGRAATLAVSPSAAVAGTTLRGVGSQPVGARRPPSNAASVKQKKGIFNTLGTFFGFHSLQQQQQQQQQHESQILTQQQHVGE